MQAEPRRIFIGAIIGFIYGSILAVLALAAMGAGHGTWIPFLISSAPLGVLTRFGDIGTFIAIFGGAPIIWAIFGALDALPARPRAIRTIQILILSHYLSGLVLVFSAEFDEFNYMLRLLRIFPAVPVIWAIIYLAGQVVLWRRTIRRSQGVR